MGRRQRTDAAALPEAYDELLRPRSSNMRPKERNIPRYNVVVLSDPRAHDLHWNRAKECLSKTRRISGQSYVVDIEGKRLLRNQRFLRPRQAAGKTNPTPPIATTELPKEVLTKPEKPPRYPKRNRRPRVPFQSTKTKMNRR